jgi:hypothetical protein
MFPADFRYQVSFLFRLSIQPHSSFTVICVANAPSLITYYLTSVLSGMGLSDLMSRVISGVNGTCYFLTSLIAITIIERVGRRPLMLWTAAAQCATMAVLAGLYNIEQVPPNGPGNKAAQVVSVLCLFLFNTWFSIGWLGMTWLYPAEVTPLRIRAPANALSTASNWIFNFMVRSSSLVKIIGKWNADGQVVMATGPMFANIRWGTYALFAALNGLVIFPSVYLFFPETKKYSLEDVSDLPFSLFLTRPLSRLNHTILHSRCIPSPHSLKGTPPATHFACGSCSANS